MKKILTIVFIVTLFLLSNDTSAQRLTPQQQQALTNLFKNKKVVYFKFKVNSLQEIPQLAKIVSVDKNKGGEVSAHATKDQFAKFLPFNYKYTIISGGTVKKKAVPVKKTVKK